MDLDVIEGLNEVVPAVYRAAFKLRSLQNLCQMHLVTLSMIGPALESLAAGVGPTGSVSGAELRRRLEQLFQGVSEDLSGQGPLGAAEQTCRLLFRLFDREQTGCISLRSVEVALVALSGDTLSAKHSALYVQAERCSRRQGLDSGTVTRRGLRVMLQDLSQIPAAVQESQVFGEVESAVRTCFQGVLTAGVTEEAFLCWIRSEPRLLLWVSTLYRISASEAVLHRVRCHVCRAFPITGLRYRCLKCLNVHLCQTCFLTQKRSNKHKPSHPVMEHCTQPSFREALSSLAHSARHTLRPRRQNRRQAEGRSVLSAQLPPRIPYSVPTTSLQSQAMPPQALDPPFPPRAESEATPIQTRLESLQTDAVLQPQRRTSLLKKDLNEAQMEVQDLQRHKQQLEQQLQEWREAVRSQHSSLEDKCCHLEATVGVLTRHSQNLQDELGRIRLLLQNTVPGVSMVTRSGEGSAGMELTTEECPLLGQDPPAAGQEKEVQFSESEEAPESSQASSTGESFTPEQVTLMTPDPRCGEELDHSPHWEKAPAHAGTTRLHRAESALEQEEPEHAGTTCLHRAESALEQEEPEHAGTTRLHRAESALEQEEPEHAGTTCLHRAESALEQEEPEHAGRTHLHRAESALEQKEELEHAGRTRLHRAESALEQEKLEHAGRTRLHRAESALEQEELEHAGSTRLHRAESALEQEELEHAGRTRLHRAESPLKQEEPEHAGRTHLHRAESALKQEEPEHAGRTRLHRAESTLEQEEELEHAGTTPLHRAESALEQEEELEHAGRTRLHRAESALKQEEPEHAGRTHLHRAESALKQEEPEHAGRTRLHRTESTLEQEEELEHAGTTPLHRAESALEQEEELEHAGRTCLHRAENSEEKEQELADLVQHLKVTLSVKTSTGPKSVWSQELQAAAEALEDSISQLVSAVSASQSHICPLSQSDCPAFSTNRAAALSELRSNCTPWSSTYGCYHRDQTAQVHSTESTSLHSVELPL